MEVSCSQKLDIAMAQPAYWSTWVLVFLLLSGTPLKTVHTIQSEDYSLHVLLPQSFNLPRDLQRCNSISRIPWTSLGWKSCNLSKALIFESPARGTQFHLCKNQTKKWDWDFVLNKQAKGESKADTGLLHLDANHLAKGKTKGCLHEWWSCRNLSYFAKQGSTMSMPPRKEALKHW